ASRMRMAPPSWRSSHAPPEPSRSTPFAAAGGVAGLAGTDRLLRSRRGLLRRLHERRCDPSLGAVGAADVLRRRPGVLFERPFQRVGRGRKLGNPETREASGSLADAAGLFPDLLLVSHCLLLLLSLLFSSLRS